MMRTETDHTDWRRLARQELAEWGDAIFSCIPGRVGRALRRTYWRLRVAQLGDDASIGRGFVLHGAHRIRIGSHLCVTGNVFLSAEGGQIVIGDHVAFNSNVHINASVGGKIHMGDYVMIGPNCVLRASNHVFDDPDVPMQEQGHRSGEIVLEDDVWLGANVTVVEGVRIGHGSVVAAGAVVTKDVEPGSVVGGVPAHLIRRRDETQRLLPEMKR